MRRPIDRGLPIESDHHWADPIEMPQHPNPLAFIAVRLAISVAAVAAVCALLLALAGVHV